MSDLRPKPGTISLGGNEYGVLFSINVIDDIQDHFDISIEQLSDVLQDPHKRFKVLKYLLTALINEAIDDEESGKPHVDIQWVGRKLRPDNMGELVSKSLKALHVSMPETEDDDSPNAQSE